MSADRATTAEIVANHYAAAGFMVDAVFTVPHAAGESLAQVIERLELVWKALRSKAIWRELSDELGIAGCIRRLEVTLTENGWHPHYHVSFLCDWRSTAVLKGHTRAMVLVDAHAMVAGRWADAGLKAGVKVCLWAQAAVAVVAAVDAAKAVDYNAKNMGYGGDKKSLTPIDLLRIEDQLKDPVTVHAAKRLFGEYAEAIKGKHVLTFLGTARTAKAALSEEPQAVLEVEEADLLGTVSADAWGAVTKCGLRSEIALVTTREALEAIVGKAATAAGFASIPMGWLTLTLGIKTVIRVKRPSTAVRAGDACLV